MADLLLSKVKVGEQVYNLKDTTARQTLGTLLEDHALEALKAAAWHDMAANMSDVDGKIADAKTVKDYVDAQIGTIHKFDIVVADELPTASADTMYKLYLIPKASSKTDNVKEEWITIRSGSESSYTYAWEKIGDTEVDLSDYLKTAEAEGWKVAGKKFGGDHEVTAEELETALDLKALAHKASASANYQPAGKIDALTVTPAGTITLRDLTQTETTATISAKADYKPAGTVTLNDLTQTATDITSTGKYTPAGTIAAATVNGAFTALTAATFARDDNGVQIEGTNAASTVTITPATDTFVKSLKSGNVAAASFTEGAFTAATIQEGFVKQEGEAASWTGATYTASTLGEATTGSFATQGLVAAIDGSDEEMLVFSAASTSSAVTAQGTFTAGTVDFGTFKGGQATIIDTTKFSGGSKAADTFSAEKLPVVDASAEAWVDYTGATAAAQTFTGAKYKNNVDTDTALKKVTFTGTQGDVTVAGKYDKATANGASFEGTKVENLIPTEVKYNQASANGATFKGTAATLSPVFTGTTATITVE